MTPSGAALAALEQLDRATPAPPAADADPAAILRTGTEIVDARQRCIRELDRVLSEHPDAIADSDRATEILTGLRDRDAAWNDALARARRQIGDRLQAVRHLRNKHR